MIFAPPDHQTLRAIEQRRAAAQEELNRERATLARHAERSRNHITRIAHRHPVATAALAAAGGFCAIGAFRRLSTLPIIGAGAHYAFLVGRMVALRTVMSKVPLGNRADADPGFE